MEQLVIMQASEFKALLVEASKMGAMEYAALQSESAKEDPDELISVADIAAKFKVKKDTILDRIKAKHIPTAPYPKMKRMFAVQRRYLWQLATH